MGLRSHEPNDSGCVSRMRRWSLVLAVGFGMTACSRSQSILSAAGPIADGDSLILLNSLGIMLLIVVPTILATLVFAWWFRASNKAATYRPTWTYSGRLEVLVWAIPTLVVLFLGGLAWIGSHKLDPAQPITSQQKPLEVEVVALDWRWLFIYPDYHVASVNKLVLPVETPVHFRITSSAVMNVFFIPKLGSEIYAMNGMATELNVIADQTGTLPSLAAHFSGDGFANMSFETDVVTPDKFEQFVASTSIATAPLDEGSYRALSHQSHDKNVLMFSGVVDGLFDRIVSRHLPPGDGPEAVNGIAAAQAGER